jgi:Cdc6-like AAA superfamily ATPase
MTDLSTPTLLDIEEGVHILAMCQQDIQDGKMRNQLLDWIPSIDYTGRQNALQREIQEGTGQWFVNTVYFHTWLHQKGGMLFCTGMPGAGKTHIASLVIHYLQSSCSLNPRSLLAYIYCEYTHQLTRETLLGSLLEQLTRLLPTLPPELSTLYKKHEKSRTQPSVKELRTVLHEIVTSSKMCFIVVDGLDECTDDEGMRTFLLETLTALRKSLRASIMTMSRDIQHIRDHFSAQDYLEIKVRATDHDVGVYLDHRIPRVLPLLADDLGLCRTIKAVIAGQSKLLL